MNLEYLRDGLRRVSPVLHWDAIPVPVRARSGLVVGGPGGASEQMGIGLSIIAIVAEHDAAAGISRPVVVSIDENCNIVD